MISKRAGLWVRVCGLVVLSSGCALEEPTTGVVDDSARRACPEDDNPCTRAQRHRGACVQRAVEDGTACNVTGVCMASVCVESNADSGTPPAPDAGVDAPSSDTGTPDTTVDAPTDEPDASETPDAGVDAPSDSSVPDAPVDAPSDGCVPLSCSDVVTGFVQCGSFADGCGGTLQCTCSGGNVCNWGAYNVCGGGGATTAAPANVRKVARVTITGAERFTLYFEGEAKLTDPVSGAATGWLPDGWSPTTSSVRIRRASDGVVVGGGCPGTAYHDSSAYTGAVGDTTYTVSLLYFNGEELDWLTFTTPASVPETVPPAINEIVRLAYSNGTAAVRAGIYDATAVGHVEIFVGSSTTPILSAEGHVLSNGGYGYYFATLIPPELHGDTVFRVTASDIFGNTTERSQMIALP